MRDIKLRAWYKGYKANDGTDASIPSMMCDVVGFQKTSDHYDTYILDSKKYTGSGRFAVPVFRVQSDESNCEIMQYTGHNDKNGKEIFDGDIVGFPACINPIGNGLTVSFYGIGVLKWDGFNQRNVVELKNKYTGHKMPLNGYICEKDYEVLGNIHENSELLNE